MFRYLLGVVLLCGSAVAMADEVDLALSNKSALFRYIQQFNGEYGQSQVDTGLLYTSGDKNSGSDGSNVLFMQGIQVEGEAGSDSPGLYVGVGIKAFAGNVEASTIDSDFFAVAIGGELRFVAAPRLVVRATLYHAPDIVTFIDADRFTYVTFSLEYEILPQASVYLGYRNVDIGITGNDSVDFNSDIHIGLRIGI